jgi:hypothetical protein
MLDWSSHYCCEVVVQIATLAIILHCGFRVAGKRILMTGVRRVLSMTDADGKPG